MEIPDGLIAMMKENDLGLFFKGGRGGEEPHWYLQDYTESTVAEGADFETLLYQASLRFSTWEPYEGRYAAKEAA